MLPDERHDVEGTDLRGARRILEADIAADHPMELDLAIPAGDDARRIEKVAHLLDRDVGSQGFGRLGQLEAERTEGRLRRIHRQGSPRAGREQARSTSSVRIRRTVKERVALLARKRQPEPVKRWLTEAASM